MSLVPSFRLLADENLNGALLRGLRRRHSDLDVVRVQDVGLSGVDDPGVLEWAARQGRIVLTHDVRTMIRYAGERVDAGLMMPGLIVIQIQDASFSQILENLSLILEVSAPEEWVNRWEFIPLR
jgi:predicted nuclease of predicted toxin-antitoxin system